MIRRRAILAAAAVFGVVVLSACGPPRVIEQISTAETCKAATEILEGMATVLIQAAANPLGAEVYVARFRELSANIEELNPLDPDLNGALGEVSAGIDGILDVLETPNVLSLVELPSRFAQAQVSLKKVFDKCEALVSA